MTLDICDKYQNIMLCLFFQIYNGSMSEEALVGKYCGTIESLVIVTHLVLFVEFISDGSVNGHGFNATYFHVSGMLRKINTILITDQSQTESI